jgi:hypothetical protein
VNLEDIRSWRYIKSIKEAKMYAVENPPEGFVEWATAPEQGAVLIQNEEEWMELIAKKRPELTKEKQ